MSHVFPPPLDGHYRLLDGRIQTRSLEAHVVDHCNLTCAECCSLSPLLPRWQVAPETLARDLSRAGTVLAPRIFKLVGGEPLLHPDLVELARLVRRSRIAPVVSVTTNGLLLPRMPDAFWDEVDALTISLYPQPALPAETIAYIEQRAARGGVRLNWKRQDEFVRMTRPAPSADEAENRAVWSECWIRERCHMLHEGVFYTCTRPPHFAALHQNDGSGDGIRLHDGVGLRDQVLAYLTRAEPLAACAHCYGGNGQLEPHRLLSRAELTALRRP